MSLWKCVTRWGHQKHTCFLTLKLWSKLATSNNDIDIVAQTSDKLFSFFFSFRLFAYGVVSWTSDCSLITWAQLHFCLLNIHDIQYYHTNSFNGLPYQLIQRIRMEWPEDLNSMSWMFSIMKRLNFLFRHIRNDFACNFSEVDLFHSEKFCSFFFLSPSLSCRAGSFIIFFFKLAIRDDMIVMAPLIRNSAQFVINVKTKWIKSKLPIRQVSNMIET